MACNIAMNLKQAIVEAGGVSAVAARLQVTPQRLTNWVERGIPVDKCAAVEMAVEGRIKRQELRPDDWKAIWPELTDAPASQPADL